MNFDLSAEQTLLADSVARFVSDNYELEARQKLAAGKTGYSDEHWQTFAELGWLGLTLPEAAGGFGGNQIDTLVLSEQFGRGLVTEPFWATVVLGARAVALGARPEVGTPILERVVQGQCKLALAYAEEAARFDLFFHTTEARQGEDGSYVLNGHKSMVQNAGDADYLIVAARTDGAPGERDGLTLFLVPGDAPGLKVAGFPTVDGLRAGEVDLENVTVPADYVLGDAGAGAVLLETVAVDGILALAAEAVGAMEILYKDTVEYTQQREQFDHALSDFQVVKHRLVDMFMEYEQSKSLLYRATLEVAEQGLEARRTVHALKYYIGRAGIMIGENAVQLHGGMGVTEELRIGHYFKRLLVIDAQFGNSDYHLAQFAA